MIRGDSTREFGCAEIPGDPTCPVRAFKQYVVESSKLFKWAWDKGSYWVFPYIGMRGDRLATNVTAPAMAQRFNKYLKGLEPGDSEQQESRPLSLPLGIRAEGRSLSCEIPARRRRDPRSAAPYPARTATAVYSFFSFFCRRSGCLLLLSSDLRPSACC